MVLRFRVLGSGFWVWVGKEKPVPRHEPQATDAVNQKRETQNAKRAALSVALMLLLPGLLYAQVPDTLKVTPDSLQVVPDSLQATPDSTAPHVPTGPPMGFRLPEPATATTDTMLALSFELDAAGVLATRPASFFYDFGEFGWPNGWSPYGLTPNRVALLLGGLPFDDPVTGRPRYDLLPLSILKPLGLQAGRHAAPMAVYAQVRPYEIGQPFTEMHYRSGGGGLQSILAIHTQRRRLSLFGRPGVLRVLFGYGGHAARGAYDGSRLRRMRQLITRVRYQQTGWSVEAAYLHNQRRLGAHSGVNPTTPYEAIYNQLIATVRNPNAFRQTIRNDLSVTLRARLVPGLADPLTISAFTTLNTFRYRNPGADTLVAKTNRYGARVHQDLQIGPHRLRLLVEAWTDRLARSNALPGDPTRSQLHVTLHDSLRLGRFEAIVEGGAHVTAHARFAGGAARVARRLGPVRVFAEALHAGQPASWVEEYGFGRFVAPVDKIPDGRVSQGRAGLRFRARAFDVAVFGFAHEESKPLDLYTTATEDSIEARVAPAPFQRLGLGSDLGWRRTARRGFYATAQPTLVRFLDANASDAHRRMDAALPTFFVQGRLGARYALFTNDLILDLSVRGRFWTELRSRTLHAPTGLLVLPRAEDDFYPASGFLPASGTVDVVAEAAVRTARLFLAYENAFSGTQVLLGNQIVPIYPLPAQRLRFGVFWPILN